MRACVQRARREEKGNLREWRTVGEVNYFMDLKMSKVLCVALDGHQIVYSQESGSVFRKVQQDRRFSRLGGVAWSVCVGH